MDRFDKACEKMLDALVTISNEDNLSWKEKRDRLIERSHENGAWQAALEELEAWFTEEED